MARMAWKATVAVIGAAAALYCIEHASLWRVRAAPMRTYIPAKNDALWYCMRRAHLSREARLEFMERVLDDSVNQGLLPDSLGRQYPRYLQGGLFIENTPIRLPDLMLSGGTRCEPTIDSIAEDTLGRRS